MTVCLVTARLHIIAAQMALGDDTRDSHSVIKIAEWRLQQALQALPSFADQRIGTTFWLGSEGDAT